ncbi:MULTISPECIES: lysozyme family protein [unclassified Streptococcus]|uniref:lysozyme family protein n=1 Tax=unclassified Streptococcus TaxID=2608887 RepID=UPI001071ECCF|nr:MULTISPECIES: lysozyme family protein [unclassified Streptococcus]MBF0805290.1 lysozyme family protein [Streptococcus sp. 19428wA2_WM07]TFU29324.1 lysozyme family protein [Streptococcus sp. WM07]
MIKRIFSLLLLSFLFLGIWKGWQTVQTVAKVSSYQPLVEEALKKEHSTLDSDLILAIIYTETKGQGQDIMQASESLTGEVDSLTNPQESIEHGVKTLNRYYLYSQSLGVDEWTFVQAYNFGQAYIDYVAENGQKTSLDLAQVYSRDIVAPSLGNHSGETYAYWTPISIFHGHELYRNGGNYFYANQVRLNLDLIRFFKRLT